MSEEVIRSGASPDPVAVVQVPDPLPIPLLGTVVELDKPDSVAQALADVERAVKVLAEVRRHLEDVIVDEARRQGTKTLHLSTADVEIRDDKKLVWDIETLEQLRAAGLPEERWDALVTARIEHRVSALVARQLEGANEEYARIVGAARSYEERPRPGVRVRPRSASG